MNDLKFYLSLAWLLISFFAIISMQKIGWLEKPHYTMSGKEAAVVGNSPSWDISQRGWSPSKSDLEAQSANTAAPASPTTTLIPDADGLIGLWRFDYDEKTQSFITEDGHKLGYNLGINARVLPSKECVSGACLSLSATEKQGAETWFPDLSDYTFSGWVKLSSLYQGESQIFQAADDSAGLTISDGSPLFFDGSVLTAPLKLKVGEFYHLAVTHSPTEKKIYVNGAEVARGNSDQAMMAGDGAFGKALFNDDRYLNGVIDDFRLYNRVLSAVEIKGLYQAFTPK